MSMIVVAGGCVCVPMPLFGFENQTKSDSTEEAKGGNDQRPSNSQVEFTSRYDSIYVVQNKTNQQNQRYYR